MDSYLEVVYDKTSHPKSQYPKKLCRYLFNYFNMSKNMNLLEVGCGYGEFLKCFQEIGLRVRGVDISSNAKKYQAPIPVKICDLEKQKLPYEESSFDIVYSKSFIEHLEHPERFFKEALRVLKPGGLLLTLVPDWESNFKVYYDDFTHRTPFTKISLRDLYRISCFDAIEVFRFRQLPIVWKFPILNYLCAAISPFVPLRSKIKFFRWSRELMLVGSGRKRSSTK